MQFGLYLPNFGAFADPVGLAALAATAEAAGWDGLFLWDHVVRREGDYDLADPWISLAAVATATSRLRIGPLVTPLPRRRPWNVAKQAVTLDHLSGGRMVLGVGLGTPRGPEFPAFGEETDLRVRGDMLDEALIVVRRAWSGETVRHTGPHYRVEGVRFLPRSAWSSTHGLPSSKNPGASVPKSNAASCRAISASWLRRAHARAVSGVEHGELNHHSGYARNEMR